MIKLEINVLDGYYFSSNGNVLNINSGGFKFRIDTDNRFLILTSSYNITYYQFLTITVANYSTVPQGSFRYYEFLLVFFYLIKIRWILSCRIPQFCVPFELFKRVSESNQLVLDSECTSGCSDADIILYQYKINSNSGNATNYVWQEFQVILWSQ